MRVERDVIWAIAFCASFIAIIASLVAFVVVSRFGGNITPAIVTMAASFVIYVVTLLKGNKKK